MLNRLNQYYKKQQFFPGILGLLVNPFYYIRKDIARYMKLLAPKLDGKLLDFGCGSKPYQSLFTNVRDYVGVDIENEGHSHQAEDIDVFFDGTTVPFENETFDSLLATEVLEHVPNIEHSLQELQRVLKAKGKILITVPFVWAEHELPYDFRRLSLNGLEEILLRHGFKILYKYKSGSFFKVIAQLWMAYLHNLLNTKLKYLNVLLNILFIFPSCLLVLPFIFIFPKRTNLYFNSIILAEKL